MVGIRKTLRGTVSVRHNQQKRPESTTSQKTKRPDITQKRAEKYLPDRITVLFRVVQRAGFPYRKREPRLYGHSYLRQTKFTKVFFHTSKYTIVIRLYVLRVVCLIRSRRYCRLPQRDEHRGYQGLVRFKPLEKTLLWLRLFSTSVSTGLRNRADVG